jgi:hypothetical protein
MFAEPRSDIHDLWPAVVKLVRAEGPQSLRGVFKRLPNYFRPTKGDLRWSVKRRGDRMWQSEVRNLSRNQNRDPTYRKYKSIPNCPLEYVGMKAGSHGGLFILHELDDRRDTPDVHDTKGSGEAFLQRSLFDMN